MKLSFALIVLFAALPLQAQTASPQGSAVPDASIATSRPNGSSILPGEQGGVPRTAPEKVPQPCRELPAGMRDECLSRQRTGAAPELAQPVERGGSSIPPPRR
jgi:hypothetical protein